jgi:hypothetical protein
MAKGQSVHNLRLRHLENPFLVLEVAVSAGIADIERQGQKLLAMLAAGLAEAEHYPTPFGRYPRTQELVRTAMSELREPARRLRHEFWAVGWRRES